MASDDRIDRSEQGLGGEAGSDLPLFSPSIDPKDVFRELIAEELRSGRLNAARRRRVVRYAAQLRMSAVEAGQLVVQAREKALRSEDEAERRFALRLVVPEVDRAPSCLDRIPFLVKLAVVIGLAIIFDILLLCLLR